MRHSVLALGQWWLNIWRAIVALVGRPAKPVGDGSRDLAVDLAKGIAGLLMIMGHIALPYLFRFGIFAPPLFFACSGMNTFMFYERYHQARAAFFYFLFFPLLLFFGGYIQIVLVHSARSGLLPEFLQLIALSMILLLMLFKLTKKSSWLAWLSFLPFILYLAIPLAKIIPWEYPPRFFIISTHWFALIPWSGFFLFGVFLRHYRKKIHFVLVVLLLISLVALLGLRSSIAKFPMSLSYISLGLFAISFIYLASSQALKLRRFPVLHAVLDGFMLVGQNGLMFLFLHYLVLRYFFIDDLFENLLLSVIAEAFYLFLLCVLLLRFYDKVKANFSLFLPALLLFLLLGAIRCFNGFYLKQVDLRLVDMILGLLFAFLYVQLRHILKKAFWAESVVLKKSENRVGGIAKCG